MSMPSSLPKRRSY